MNNHGHSVGQNLTASDRIAHNLTKSPWTLQKWPWP